MDGCLFFIVVIFLIGGVFGEPCQKKTGCQYTETEC